MRSISQMPASSDIQYQKTIKDNYLSKPKKVCLAGDYKTFADSYRRLGGWDAGFLVVPFKVRGGDLYGDSAIDPYLSYIGYSFTK